MVMSGCMPYTVQLALSANIGQPGDLVDVGGVGDIDSQQTPGTAPPLQPPIELTSFVDRSDQIIELVTLLNDVVSPDR
jgi:hypothetical protein